MTRNIAVMTLLILFATEVSAEEHTLAIPAQVQPLWPSENDLCREQDGCVCQEDLSRFPVTPPKDMTLTAVCGYKSTPTNNHLTGTFYFGGNAAVHGKLIIERLGGKESAQDYLYFSGDPSSSDGGFGRSINHLKITTSALLSSKMDYPELSAINNCWTADAVLIIKSLTAAWTERDVAGSFRSKFEIANVGKFNKCELL